MRTTTHLAAEVGQAKEGHEGGQANGQELDVDAPCTVAQGIHIACFELGGTRAEGQVQEPGELAQESTSVGAEGALREGKEPRGGVARGQQMHHLCACNASVGEGK